MPQRLIDANALLHSMCCLDGETQCDTEDCIRYKERKYIEAAPTIEAEPVRHGHWENITGMNNTVFCSECLAAANKELAMKYKGCPFCLARMDGGADNGNG